MRDPRLTRMFSLVTSLWCKTTRMNLITIEMWSLIGFRSTNFLTGTNFWNATAPQRCIQYFYIIYRWVMSVLGWRKHSFPHQYSPTECISTVLKAPPRGSWTRSAQGTLASPSQFGPPFPQLSQLPLLPPTATPHSPFPITAPSTTPPTHLHVAKCTVVKPGSGCLVL